VLRIVKWSCLTLFAIDVLFGGIDLARNEVNKRQTTGPVRLVGGRLVTDDARPSSSETLNSLANFGSKAFNPALWVTGSRADEFDMICADSTARCVFLRGGRIAGAVALLLGFAWARNAEQKLAMRAKPRPSEPAASS
jgi:hypothetical protein